MKEIRVGFIGVGNCCSATVQGRYYYENASSEIPGLITRNFGGYTVDNITFTCAFDIDKRKVGQPLEEAIFQPPNCTKIFQKEIPPMDCIVYMGYHLDSFAEHMKNFPPERRFVPLNNIYENDIQARKAVVQKLRETDTRILVNFLPVGSEKTVEFYATCCLEAGVALVNAMPVFLSKTFGEEFRDAGIPIIGDDVKSQVGATIIHRVLTKLFEDRGQPIKSTYQLNVGGNTDFLNMIDRTRLKSKRISKTNAVTSQLNDPSSISDENIYIGPSDYIPWLNDNKICFIRIEAEQFGGIPMNLELRLSVEDSPNSAGVITDAIRAAQVALDRKMAGPIVEAAAYLFKSPPVQYDDDTARKMLIDFARSNIKSSQKISEKVV